MNLDRALRLDRIPETLQIRLTEREVAIWVMPAFLADAGVGAVADVLRLPWRLILNESADTRLLDELESPERASDPLVPLRGYLQLVDTNPNEVVLPPRCLPVYLLNGRGGDHSGGIARLTRRLNMLDELRRAQPKELLILAGSGPALPDELAALWHDGLRTVVTVVSESPIAVEEVQKWREARPFGTTTACLSIPAINFCRDLSSKYLADRSSERIALRIRDSGGELKTIDITGTDSPEHPLFANYELLQERDLSLLQPHDLQREEALEFIRGSSSSWRPYAAGMPWQRDQDSWNRVRARLRRLDYDGPEESRVAYISAESGAGGTTLLRQLAWNAAADGYPTLIARSAPFTPKALEIVTLIGRVLDLDRAASSPQKERLYEAPWVVAFDKMHWEGRTEDLRRFLREFERSGRPVCVLIVKGPYTEIELQDKRYFLELAHLSHQLSLDQALALGDHLNRFLQYHGAVRSKAEWHNFYDTSTVQERSGIAAFWIALSFWLQRQFDFRETVQSWIYRQFKEKNLAPEVRHAILDIAALSSERHPLPDGMLPPTVDWPVSQKLEDIRKEVPALALARISRDGDRYWAMAHDVIGRYLLNGMFYDRPALEHGGLDNATGPEHLRFLILRRLSRLPALGLAINRPIAEEFAISIFKIDPDHGHANFRQFWPEVLAALDEMPKNLRTTSRTFLHHTAVSRRRIAKQVEYFPMHVKERIELLERAVRDIRYALDNIPASEDGESDLNLYNSLAHAYQDLEELEVAREASAERVSELRRLAHEATQRAYRADPDNSFVVETYARSLLNDARAFPERSAENSVEVLNIVYAAMDRDRSGQRRFNLSKLADAAISLMLDTKLLANDAGEPISEIEALVQAIQTLAKGARRFEGMALKDFPESNRRRAAELLAKPLLQGNPQAVRLRYALQCLDAPKDFKGQLELLQALQDDGGVFTPQMRLELALLCQQCDRHFEAQRLFRDLRRLWREGDYYVEVPNRLRWLLTLDGTAQRQVTAKVTGDNEYRRAAKVRELQDTEVYFRPEEFGQERFKPGAVIRGFISFGHNGPFLRPTTAGQA